MKASVEELHRELQEHGFKNLGNTLKNRSKRVTLIDNEGYLYYQSMTNLKREGWKSKKFYPTNPYSLYNVKKYALENYGVKCLSEEYKSYDKEKMEWECPKCKKPFLTTFNHICNGRTNLCLECSKEKYSESNSVKDEIVIKSFNNVGLKIFSTKGLRGHNLYSAIDEEGYLYYTSYSFSTSQGYKGKRIDPKNPYSIYNIKHFIEINNLKCKLLTEEYVNCDEELLMQCECGDIYTTNWSSFSSNKNDRCEKCSLKMSKGEVVIQEYLQKNNIIFKTQFRFEDCKDKRALPFDFYLPDENIAIEFDGLQHFEPINWFGGEERFEEGKRKDKIKDEYCKNHNIKLIRIPYWEFENIENILKSSIE